MGVTSKNASSYVDSLDAPSPHSYPLQTAKKASGSTFSSGKTVASGEPHVREIEVGNPAIPSSIIPTGGGGGVVVRGGSEKVEKYSKSSAITTTATELVASSSSFLSSSSSSPKQSHQGHQLSPLNLPQREYLCTVQPPFPSSSPTSAPDAPAAMPAAGGGGGAQPSPKEYHPFAQRFLFASQTAARAETVSPLPPGKKNKNSVKKISPLSFSPSLVSTIPAPPPLVSSFATALRDVSSSSSGGGGRGERHARRQQEQEEEKEESGGGTYAHSSSSSPTISPRSSTTCGGTTITPAVVLLSAEQEEFLALKSQLANTTNRMSYLKEITPEVDVTQILSSFSSSPLAAAAAGGGGGNNTKASSGSGEAHGRGNEKNRTSAAKKISSISSSYSAGPANTPTPTSSHLNTHEQKGIEGGGRGEGIIMEGSEVAARQDSSSTHPPRGPAVLSTAERARRAGAAQRRNAARNNFYKNTHLFNHHNGSGDTIGGYEGEGGIGGGGAVGGGGTSGMGEEGEEEDLEEALKAIPSPPSFNVDGSRYFVARLARGTPQLFGRPSSRAAGGSPRNHPTTKHQSSPEEEEDDEEVEALYRQLYEQEKRLHNRFKDLRHRWMQMEREDEQETAEDENANPHGGNDDQQGREDRGNNSASPVYSRPGGGGGPSPPVGVSRHATRFPRTKARKYHPSIPPDEPSVFSAETEDEVREKAAAADEFVKNHNNRRRRQHRQQMLRRQKLLWREKQKKKKREEKGRGEGGGGEEGLKTGGSGDAEDGGLLTPTTTSGMGDTVDSMSTNMNSSDEDDAGGVSSSTLFSEESQRLEGGEWNLSDQDPHGRGRSDPITTAAGGGGVEGGEGSEVDGGEKSLHPASTPPPRKLTVRLTGEGGTEARLGMTSSSLCSPVLAEAAMAIMGMLENRADVILPSPSETTQCRQGDVLSGSFMLKLDLQDALRDRTGATGMIAGAPYFRIVPKFNIAGVAQANANAIRTILNELRRAHIEAPIIWVNLREEPLVYIHNNAHIVRERAHPLEPIIIPNATGRSIEMVENKLKAEVLAEARANGGNISVCVEGKDGTVEDQWVSASPQSVFTTQEVFSSISCSTYGRSQLQYYRWPITQNVGPQPEHFDFVLEACLEEPKAVFIFNCQTGRGRTSTMMQIANIVRFYQFCVKDVAVDGRLLRSAVHGPKFKTIQQLISLLPDGKLHQRRVFTLMDLADKVYSMADHITDAFENQDNDPQVAMMRLQQYAYFLVFSFYCEQRLWNFQIKDSFADWLTANAEMKRLIAGIREKLSDQLREERIGEDAPSDMDGKTLHIIRHRAGNVLSSGRILCNMVVPKDSTPKDLRQLAPGVAIFTCGRMSEEVSYAFLEDIKANFPSYRTIYFLSVRAEPHVVINGSHYTICEVTTVPGEADVRTSMHVSAKAMEQLEDRLRRDVLLESQENKGSILVHQMNESGERRAGFVKVIHAKTPKSMMEDFAQKSGAVYVRIPIPFATHMITADIDPLLRFLSETDCHKQDVFIINDSDGGTRTSVVLNILTLYRASRFAPLRSLQSCRDIAQTLRCCEHSETVMPMAGRSMVQHISNCTHVPERRVEVLLASTICQMLTAGSLLKTMDAVMDLGGVGKEWNILHYLDHLKNQIGVMGRSKPQCIQTALRGLRSYLEVLLVSLYLDHNGDFTPNMPFNTWVSVRKEVFNILTRLETRGENALQYVNAENLMKADVSRRCGDVLTANFCLKADHFPGCQKQGLRPALCGAPNFRKVDLVNVYGVAITTLVGLHNVLSLLGASEEPLLTYPGQRNDTELYRGFAAPRLFDPAFKPEELRRPLRGSCLWINLREEPILYVGDRPFVFRDLAAPYVNVELTGIETKKIEHVENQLKVDVLNEADKYNGKFLVHDEAQPGELVGMWEPASEETVKTTREVYNEVVSKGYRCMMLRLPVTDEQSPEIRDFDLMVNALLPSIAAHMDRRETLSFVFNCQMGRGRTTTGMVICCLLIGLVIPEYFAELHNNYYQSLNDENLSEKCKGNYGIVNQLKRILLNGRKGKERVDLVLEACSKMQNLRTAIENFVLVQQSPDFTEGQRARAHHAGIHYLVRYFNLIVFAVYLEEEYNRMQKKMRCTFEEWMLDHPEITTIAQTASLT